MSEDALYVTAKQGSLYDPKDPLVGIKHEMIGEYVDEAEWKEHGNNLIIPDNQLRVFPMFQVDRKYKPLIESCLTQMPDDELERSHCLDFDLIANAIGSSTIKDSWASKDVSPLVDLRGKNLNDFIKSSDYIKNNSEILSKTDLNAFSSGTKSIGSGGGYDYLTVLSAMADQLALTGDVTLNIVTNITDSGTPINSLASNGYAWQLTSPTYHNGDPTSAIVVSSTTTAVQFLRARMGGSTPKIHGFRINQDAPAASAGKNLIYSDVTTVETHVYNMFLDGMGNTGMGMRLRRNKAHKVYSNVIWDFPSAGNKGIFFDSDVSASAIMQNNFVYGCDVNIDLGGRACTLKNNAALGGITSDFTNIAAGTGIKNMDTDSTGEIGRAHV